MGKEFEMSTSEELKPGTPRKPKVHMANSLSHRTRIEDGEYARDVIETFVFPRTVLNKRILETVPPPLNRCG